MPDTELAYSKRISTPRETPEREPSYSGAAYTSQRSEGYWIPNGNTRINLAIGPTTIDGQGINGNVTRFLYFGLGADVHFRYFGADVDGYYGNAAMENGQSFIRDGSLQQFGGMVNMNAELPLLASQFLFVPKVGIGYGINSLYLEGSGGVRNNSSLVTFQNQQVVHGAYWIVGLALEPVRFLRFSGDYSRSFLTGGRFSGAVSTVDIDLGDGRSSFDRLRLGAHVRLGGAFWLGFQFIQRQVVVESVLGINSSRGLSPKQQHYLGVFGLQF